MNLFNRIDVSIAGVDISIQVYCQKLCSMMLLVIGNLDWT